MNRFEQLRYERGLTQAQVADGSGVSLRTIIRLERDQQKPTALTTKRLADFYGIPVTGLMPPERQAA